MKIFSFVKKLFVLGLSILSSSITSALKCITLNNQACKVRPKLLMLVIITLYFILLVLK